MNYNQMTSEIEKFLSRTLVLTYLRHPGTGGIFLSDLFLDVRSHFNRRISPIDVTAGLFNKVVDDLTRIGLLVVDRKAKMVVNVAVYRIVSECELTELKAIVEQEKTAQTVQKESVNGGSR